MVEEADPDDKAEIEMNKKRLQKTIADLGLKTSQAFFNVQGQHKSSGIECAVVVQVSENKQLDQNHKVTLVKAGVPRVAK